MSVRVLTLLGTTTKYGLNSHGCKWSEPFKSKTYKPSTKENTCHTVSSNSF